MSNVSSLPSTASEFIKTDDNGVEYYTEKFSGLSGMSHTGCARFVGISRQSVTAWVYRIGNADPATNTLPECFKPFAGGCLTLATSDEHQGAQVLTDILCSAFVLYYGSFAAAKNQTIEAKRALMVCNGIGLRVHIQSKTGWSVTAKAELVQPTTIDHAQEYKKLCDSLGRPPNPNESKGYVAFLFSCQDAQKARQATQPAQAQLPKTPTKEDILEQIKRRATSYGTLSAGQAKSSIRALKDDKKATPDRVRSLFQELVDSGFGYIDGSGKAAKLIAC